MIAASIVVAMFSDWDDFERGFNDGLNGYYSAPVGIPSPVVA
jgi:hypothetical protein